MNADIPPAALGPPIPAGATFGAGATGQLKPYEVVGGVVLAGGSGAAILVHTFGPVPMTTSVPFVALPATLLLVCAVLVRRHSYAWLHVFSARVALGAAVGLAATLVYDAVRPLIVVAFGFHYDPYQAIGIFGTIMTGRPASDPVALTAGWLYHFWNGVSFGVIFALVRPRGGIVWGYLWGMVLYWLTLTTYPDLVSAKLSNPGFVVTSFLGHSIWGLVLGAGIRRWSRA